MLYLVTGTPGSGKTLNTIKYVNESKQFEGRQVYYFGIRDLKADLGWIELTEEEAFKWHDLPSNSVIIFDEAYNVFPTKHGAQGTPDHVKKLAVHRHKGFDIFLICQKVSGQLDAFVRGLVNRHQHYARIMGSLNINRFTWDVCQQNPDSASARKNANVDPFRMDKKYFGVYHSADEHTHTLSVPWKRIIFMLVLVVLLFFTVQAFLGYFNRDDVSSAQDELLEVSGLSTIYQKEEKKELTLAELLTPEIDGIPWTAPIYREQFTNVQDWPRPAACIRNESRGCNCYTQQGTLLTVPDTMCNQIVERGWFDHTKPTARGAEYGLRVVDTQPIHSTTDLFLNTIKKP